MSHDTLHIVTCLANPLNWKSRPRLARAAIANWLEERNVRVTLVECAYPDSDYRLADLAEHERVTYVRVRAETLVWNKESLLNSGIARLPPEAWAVATFDADILFPRPGWSADVLCALKAYAVVQPWSAANDRGPDGEVMFRHKSFASLVAGGMQQKQPFDGKFLDGSGHEHYGHTGYAWGYRRDFLDRVGGLIDCGAIGNGDRHMAWGLIGRGFGSVPAGVSESYRNRVGQWGDRAFLHGNLGVVKGDIDHMFHGAKAKRAYKERWAVLIEHGFDPATDIIRNSFGVTELAGSKPAFAEDLGCYFRNRDEDAVAL